MFLIIFIPVMSGVLKTKAEKWMYRKGILKPKRFRVPDFIGIGAQKSGTTWLYENLKMHQDIYLPEIKELHYFDMEERFGKRLQWYFNHFTDADMNKAAGEITPAYSILPPKRIAFMNKLMPDVKLILIMRNPVERAWSQAIMELVSRRNVKYEDVKEEEFIDHIDSEASVLRTKYLQTLDNYLKFYNKEQFFICFTQEIANDPKDLLVRIFGFLNITEQVNWNDFPYKEKIFTNEKTEIPLSIRNYLYVKYKKDIEKIISLFPDKKLNWG